MSDIQLSLPLVTPLDEDGVDPNRKNILKSIVDQRHVGSNSSWRIFYLQNNKTLWLGIRTHYIETDYDYVERVTRDEAIWLVKNNFASEFLDSLKER
jgi:uncharacterized protein involved in type VI secretion and phage assembly